LQLSINVQKFFAKNANTEVFKVSVPSILQILFQITFQQQITVSPAAAKEVVLYRQSLIIIINLKIEPMKTSSITSTSNTKTVIQACLIVFVIFGTASIINKVGIHHLMMNILDWQSM
jgi:hypothetical protein